MIRAVVMICVMGGTASGAFSEPDGAGVQRVYTSEGAIDGVVVGVGDDGVSVRRDGLQGIDGMVRVVPWFDVRESGDGAWEIPEEFERVARIAAIGKARRDRGDLRGCATMYTNIAEEYLDSRSAMAGEIFGGLLEEALARGDFFDACIAVLALERAGALGGDGFDPRYGIDSDVPMLVGIDGTGGHRLDAIAELMEEDLRHVGALIGGFGVLNGAGSGGDVAEVISDLESAVRGGGEYRMGVELYAQMLTAQRHPEPNERENARAWLGSRGRMKAGSWVEDWCRCAIGASFLHESELLGGDDELVSRGVVELVHVMVNGASDRGGLAHWAMTAATKALQDRGRFDEASELAMSFDRMNDVDH